MEISGTKAWVDAARAAAILLRRRLNPLEAPVDPSRTPAVRRNQAGLRSLEGTQDLEALAAKGRIIDRYL